jgi:hypothetical protein
VINRVSAVLNINAHRSSDGEGPTRTHGTRMANAKAYCRRIPECKLIRPIKESAQDGTSRPIRNRRLPATSVRGTITGGILDDDFINFIVGAERNGEAGDGCAYG